MNQVIRRILTSLAAAGVLFAFGLALFWFGAPPRVAIDWETVSEVDTVGFALYRADTPDGPFEIITPAPIPAQGDPLVGATYTYQDRDVVWGQRYYYQLAEVGLGGQHNVFPVVVDERAGLGWAWALVGSGILAVVGWFATWSVTAPVRATDLQATRSFAVGRVALTLNGPVAWIKHFERIPALRRPTGWTVRLEPDETLPKPEGPFFEARPCVLDGGWILEAPGFVGRIEPDQQEAVLRAHPDAHPADLDYFVRTVFALCAFQAGALLFHAAGVVHRGQAFAFFGQSGSGKTTAARLSRGRPVLNDDLLLLQADEDGWQVWATPFGRRRMPEVERAPLRALLRLIQAPEEHLKAMPRAVALAELVANSPVVNADPQRGAALFAYWESILHAVPVYALQFRKNDLFWEVIDAEFT